PRLLPPRIPCGRQVHGLAERSDHCSARRQDIKTLSGCPSSHRLLRRRTRPATALSYQQLRTARTDHRTTLSLSLASGTVLQMDQTKPANQDVLWQLGQRGEDPSLDRRERLRPRRHPPQGIEARPQPIRNTANSEHHSFRENPYFSGTFNDFRPKSGWPL